MNGRLDVLLERVRETIRRYDILEPDETVLVAVSGGPDSVCLLHVLLQLGFQVEVAHFDHQTRGGESGDDAKFVADLARGWSLTCHVESRAVADEAREMGLSFEEHARKIRYEFFFKTAQERRCAAIATGHQADDQAETVLMRMLRGTTPRGLGGIPPVRLGHQARIVRPLIECTREGILSYLDARSIPYRTDRSNADSRHMRNRVRNELLPHLSAEYNPRLSEALRRLAEVQRVESDYLDESAEQFLGRCLEGGNALHREVFASGHPALQRRAVLLLAWRHGVDPPFERVDAAVRFIADSPAGHRLDLGAGLVLRSSHGLVELQPAPRDSRPDSTVALAIPGETLAFGRTFNVQYLDGLPPEALSGYCSPHRQVFDADALGTDLAVRRWRPGDRFRPLGMTGTRKLKKYLTDLKLPASEREAQLVMIAGGRIVWVVGRAVAADAAVTPGTRRVVEIRVIASSSPTGSW